MKRYLLSFAFALGGILSSHAQICYYDLPLQVKRVEPTKPIGGLPRTPVACPNIGQDGHTLYFNNVGYNLTLVLLDEDSEEAYTTIVPAGTTAVVLPASLSGDYELQLLPGGSYYFYSDITL